MHRGFLAAFPILLLCGCAGLAELADDMGVVARIGVLADTNLREAGDTRMLQKAFEYFRQEGVDAVAIAGSVTAPGVPDQQAKLTEIWRKAFAGSSVPLFAAPGRHEAKGVPFATAVDRPVGRQDVLTFYGTRRLALTDELCVYPNGNRAICAGSMSGLDLPQGYNDAELGKKLARSAEGLLVSVYADKTVIRRLDFRQGLPVDRDAAWEVKTSRRIYAEDVADPWVMDAAGLIAKPAKEVPEFWPDTRLQVLPGYIRAERVYTLRWPNVLKRWTGARARWFVVEAAFADRPSAVFLSRTILPGAYHQSEDRDSGPVKTVVRESQLPPADAQHTHVIFKVTPVGAFGKPGRSLQSNPVPLP